VPITPTGFAVTPASERITAIRAELDALLASIGLAPLSYSDTYEGALTEALGTITYDLEAGQKVVDDSLSPDTASGVQLDRIFAGRPARRAATQSRYTFRCQATSGSISYPAGSVVEGGGDDGRARWQVVATTTVTTSETQVVFEALDAGPVTMDSGSPTTLTVITPVSGLASVAYDPSDGDSFTAGRDRESDTAYRVRARRLRRSESGPTYPGLSRALLDLSWVSAVSVQQATTWELSIGIVPAPVGADQEDELAQAILANAAFPVPFSGSSSLSVDLPDGGSYTIKYTAGTTQAVTVAATIRLAAGLALADVQAVVIEAIDGVFAGLDVGDTLFYGDVYCAIMDVGGVTGITTLTLDGGTSDVTTAATTLLAVDGTPAVTV